jgi:hypothetical protein
MICSVVSAIDRSRPQPKAAVHENAEKAEKGSNRPGRYKRSPETDAWLQQLPRGETSGWLTRAKPVRATWKHIAAALEAHIAYTTWAGHTTARVTTRDEELASRFAPKKVKAGDLTVGEPTSVLREIRRELMQQQGDYSGFERQWRQDLIADIDAALGSRHDTEAEPAWDTLTDPEKRELEQHRGVFPEWRPPRKIGDDTIPGRYDMRYAKRALQLLGKIGNDPQAGENAGRYVSRAIERIDQQWRQQHREGDELREETHERERDGKLAYPLHRRIAKRVSRAAFRNELLAPTDYLRTVQAADRKRREPAPTERITYAELRERDQREPPRATPPSPEPQSE